MSGKKFGLDDKYKALGVKERTVSINPMQDDLDKSMGMTSTGSFLMRRAILSGAGAKPASQLMRRSKGIKETIKKAVTSKTNIGATAGAAGYEIGKSQGKKYGGSMKKMKSGGLSDKQKKIARMAPPPDKITGADFKAMKVKKVMGEFKKGELNIGKSKKKVKSRKQAIAIALSEARKKKA